MKKLNLIHTISLKALEAKARKAAATAAATSKKETIKSKKAKTKKIPMIEREIRSIFHTLRINATENQMVILDQSNKGSLSKAIISIYNQDDINRYRVEDAAYRELVAQAGNRGNIRKPRKPLPVVMYVFYSHTLDDQKIGSVAIYGPDASMQRNIILKNGSLFGHRVISADLEMGRRLFVDVKLAA